MRRDAHIVYNNGSFFTIWITEDEFFDLEYDMAVSSIWWKEDV